MKYLSAFDYFAQGNGESLERDDADGEFFRGEIDFCIALTTIVISGDKSLFELWEKNTGCYSRVVVERTKFP